MIFLEETANIDISAVISETINSLFSTLFSSIDNSIYSILDDITFIDSTIISDGVYKSLLGLSSNEGILIIANALLLGIILYYAISRAIAYFTGSEVQSCITFIFRMIIFGIFMNSSYFICEQILNLNSLFSSAIRNLGEMIFSKSICFSTLVSEINYTASTSSFNLFSVDGIIKSFISLGLFNLIFSYSLRYILLKVFVLLSPFAILSLIHNKTKWIFTSWLRIVFSLLFLQIFISIVLLISFSFTYSQNLLSKFMYIGCIYALIKSNHIVKDFIGGVSTNVSSPISSFKSFLGGK